MIRLGGADQDLCVTMNNCSSSEQSTKDWMNKAKTLATDQASHGDAESMYLLWEITGNDEWLEKSAEKGFALAQFRLATKYQEGEACSYYPLADQMKSKMDESRCREWLSTSHDGICRYRVEKPICHHLENGMKKLQPQAMHLQFWLRVIYWRS